ncbi:hypothetical protein L3Q82_008811, partial [Scortum barcoo]
TSMAALLQLELKLYFHMYEGPQPLLSALLSFAPGLDGIPGRALKMCADQLADVCLNNYCPLALTSTIMKGFEQLVKSSFPHFLTYWTHFTLPAGQIGQHPDLPDGQTPGCVDRHHNILHPVLNSRVHQGLMLSPLLYSLFTHDCVATHSFNTIIKFVDDMTIIGLIRSWCQDNFHLKTKQLIVDYRKWQREGQAPSSIMGLWLEKLRIVSSFTLEPRPDLDSPHRQHHKNSQTMTLNKGNIDSTIL